MSVINISRVICVSSEDTRSPVQEGALSPVQSLVQEDGQTSPVSDRAKHQPASTDITRFQSSPENKFHMELSSLVIITVVHYFVTGYIVILLSLMCRYGS